LESVVRPKQQNSNCTSVLQVKLKLDFLGIPENLIRALHKLARRYFRSVDERCWSSRCRDRNSHREQSGISPYLLCVYVCICGYVNTRIIGSFSFPHIGLQAIRILCGRAPELHGAIRRGKDRSHFHSAGILRVMRGIYLYKEHSYLHTFMYRRELYM